MRGVGVRPRLFALITHTDKLGAGMGAETPINHPDRASPATKSTRTGRKGRAQAMLKKMMLMALSVGALIAFAMPAAAQAEVYLADPEKLEPGAEITLTSTDFKTSLPQERSLQCQEVTFHFEVVTNGPDHVVLGKVGGSEGNNEGTTEGCSLTVPGFGTFPMLITDPTIDNQITLDTWGTANLGAHFTTDIAPIGIGPCASGGKIHLVATTTTNVLHAGPSKLTGPGGGGCWTESSVTGSFTIQTEDGTPIEIHSVETP